MKNTKFEWQNVLISAATAKGSKLTPDEAVEALEKAGYEARKDKRYIYVDEDRIPSYNFSLYPDGNNSPDNYTLSGLGLRATAAAKGQPIHNKFSSFKAAQSAYKGHQPTKEAKSALNYKKAEKKPTKTTKAEKADKKAKAAKSAKKEMAEAN